MKLQEIPDKAQLYLNFYFKSKEYCIGVNNQFQVQEAICVQGIFNNREPLEATKLDNVSLIYKTRDGIYHFNEITIKLVQYKGKYLYLITSTSEVERINRRADFRVYVSKSLMLKLMNDKGKTYKIIGELRDISVSGMGIIMNHKMDNVTAIEVNLQLNERNLLPIMGKIVNVIELPHNSGFLYGCYFGERKDILGRYILKQQTKNKKRIS